MMIPVVWVSYHKPDIIARGYWDQGLLERIIDRRLWRPVVPCEYFHCDGFEALPADSTGAVVVVPAQHHVGDVERLNADIGRLEWVVLILTGDEWSLFPVHEVRHDNCKLWIMDPNPSVHAGVQANFFGTGWHEDTPDVLQECHREANNKLGWFFAGQVTHSRREECVDGLTISRVKGELLETPGFTQGMDRHEYLKKTARARYVPAPSGPGTPDSFRLYEALEAGCVPIVDAFTPNKWPGFWQFLYGDVPFPVVDDWSTVSALMEKLESEWPVDANRCSAWWQNEKRKLAYRLDDDVIALAGASEPSSSPSDLITILIPSSPIRSHPSTEMIETTIESVRSQPGMADAEIIIMVDGVRQEQADRKGAYEEYKRRLSWMTNHDMHNVLPVFFEEHMHQSGMTKHVLDMVRTPLVMFVEHDAPLCGSIDFTGISRAVLSNKANVVRLHHEANILEPHRYLMLDDKPQKVCGVPMVRTVQWSQRPHVASIDFYRWMMDTYFGRNAKTMIEDLMYGVLETHWREEKMKGWEKFKVWIYAPQGDMKRSYHLDGRGEDPKFSMTFEYDGETPEWAPFPGERE